jgi:hypothetical protein
MGKFGLAEKPTRFFKKVLKTGKSIFYLIFGIVSGCYFDGKIALYLKPFSPPKKAMTKLGTFRLPQNY